MGYPIRKWNDVLSIISGKIRKWWQILVANIRFMEVAA